MLAKMDPTAAAPLPPPSKAGDLVDSHHTLDMAYRFAAASRALLLHGRRTSLRAFVLFGSRADRRVVADLTRSVAYAKTLP